MLAAGVAAIAVALAGTASAHDEPAGDALARGSTFVPADIGAPNADVERLVSVVRNANREGVAVKVAVIRSRADLGEEFRQWDKPQRYARALAKELAFAGRVIVVMPAGVGVAAPKSGAVGGSGRSSGSDGQALLAAAVRAVARVASSSGHPIPIPSAPRAGNDADSRDRDRLIIVAAGIAVLLAAAPLRRRFRAARP